MTVDNEMPLQSLLKRVTEIRERIGKHGEVLRRNEAQTRYSLIDPLLRTLGWDTADPTQVVPEYHGEGSRQAADYALLGPLGQPLVIIEAKRLYEPLREHVAQALGYCQEVGIKYFALTDGGTWEIYETHRPVPLAEKMVTSLDVKGPAAVAEVCLKALALWRTAVETGEITVGQAPILGLSRPDIPDPPSKVNPPPPRLPNGDWQLLTQLTVVKGSHPIELMLPDNTRVQVKAWGRMALEVVRWLTDKRMLRADHCPIGYSSPRSFRWIVHTQPIHRNGDGFTSPSEVNGLWVELNDNQTQLLAKVRKIIEDVGQDPAQFKVRRS